MDTARKPLAIVIPTRNRADVLEAALRTVTAQDVDGLEIIVSDNCSTDHTRDVVASARDPRVRCIRPERRLSMSHHWEFVLQHVNAEWLAVIGDDDGLLPDAAASVLAIAKDAGVPAIASEKCLFKWPGYEDNLYGILTYLADSWERIEIRDSRAAVEAVVDYRLSFIRVPRLYTGGFVKSELVEAFRQRHGQFVFSQIPDLFSALAITGMIERHAYVHRPLAISGGSRHSTGRASVERARGGAGERIRPWREFVSENLIPPHPDIPDDGHGSMLLFLPILVYESVLQLVDLGEMDASHRDHERNLARILTLSAARGKGVMRQRVREWAQAFAEQHGLDLQAVERQALHPAAVWRQRLVDVADRLPRRLRKRTIRGNRFFPLRDVYDASIVMAERIGEKLAGHGGERWWYLNASVR